MGVPQAMAIPLPVTAAVGALGVVQPVTAQMTQPLPGMQNTTDANMIADATSSLPDLPTAQPVAPPVTTVPPADISVANATQLDSAKVIARVGTEVILAGEILGPIDERLSILAKGAPEEEVEKAREMLARQRLDQAIQTKLIIGEAKRKVAADAMKTIDAKLNQLFEEKEIPKALEKMKCKDRHELDQKLRAAGNSIDRERRAFGERMIAADWVKQQTKGDQEVPTSSCFRITSITWPITTMKRRFVGNRLWFASRPIGARPKLTQSSPRRETGFWQAKGFRTSRVR
jgi:hypothetical protein